MDEKRVMELTGLILPKLEEIKDIIDGAATLSMSVGPDYMTVVYHCDESGLIRAKEGMRNYDHVLRSIWISEKDVDYESESFFNGDDMIKITHFSK